MHEFVTKSKHETYIYKFRVTTHHSNNHLEIQGKTWRISNTHFRFVFLTSKSRNVISIISSWLPMNVYNKQSILGGYGFGKSGLLKIPFSLPNVDENTRHSQPENKKLCQTVLMKTYYNRGMIQSRDAQPFMLTESLLSMLFKCLQPCCSKGDHIKRIVFVYQRFQ